MSWPKAYTSVDDLATIDFFNVDEVTSVELGVNELTVDDLTSNRFWIVISKSYSSKVISAKNSGEQDKWMSSNRWHWIDFYRKMPLYLLTTKFPIKRASVIVYFLTRITPRPRVDVVVDVATNESVRNLALNELNIANDTWFSYRNSSRHFFHVQSSSWTI